MALLLLLLSLTTIFLLNVRELPGWAFDMWPPRLTGRLNDFPQIPHVLDLCSSVLPIPSSQSSLLKSWLKSRSSGFFMSSWELVCDVCETLSGELAEIEVTSEPWVYMVIPSSVEPELGVCSPSSFSLFAISLEVPLLRGSSSDTPILTSDIMMSVCNPSFNNFKDFSSSSII